MNEEHPANLERDMRFPSGAWTGFYLQFWMPGRHKTDMHLTWSGSEVTGHGTDRVGRFTISGTYDAATGRGEWTKKYLGRHSVVYRGVNDGHGIWGVWEIRQLGGLHVDRGGFHIWPEGSNVSEESDRTEKAVMEAMQAEFGTMPVTPAAFFALLVLGGSVLALLLWLKFAS